MRVVAIFAAVQIAAWPPFPVQADADPSMETCIAYAEAQAALPPMTAAAAAMFRIKHAKLLLPKALLHLPKEQGYMRE